MGQACVASLSRNGTQCGSRHCPDSGERAESREPVLQGIGTVSLPRLPSPLLSSLAASPRVVDCGVTKGAFQPPSVSLRLTWACGACFYFQYASPAPEPVNLLCSFPAFPVGYDLKIPCTIFLVCFFFLGTRISCTLSPSAIVTRMYCVCARTCSHTCACTCLCRFIWMMYKKKLTFRLKEIFLTFGI